MYWKSLDLLVYVCSYSCPYVCEKTQTDPPAFNQGHIIFIIWQNQFIQMSEKSHQLPFFDQFVLVEVGQNQI